MNIPNFRPDVDIRKVKALYETLGNVIQIDDKEYTINIHLPIYIAEAFYYMFLVDGSMNSMFDVTIDHDGHIVSCRINGDVIEV